MELVNVHVDGDSGRLEEYRLSSDLLQTCEAFLKERKDDFMIEPEIFVFNRPGKQHRDIQFCSDISKGYFYSGQVAKANPLGPLGNEVLAQVNSACGNADGPATFNGMLINRYTDGSKYIGAHRDAREALDPKGGVFAITIGATRTFRIRDSKTKNKVIDVPARHGYALRMAGKFQDNYSHEVPIERTVLGPRTSLTFRTHDVVKEAHMLRAHEAKLAERAKVEADREAARQKCLANAAESKRKREEAQETEAKKKRKEQQDIDDLVQSKKDESDGKDCNTVNESTEGAGHGHGGPGL